MSPGAKLVLKALEDNGPLTPAELVAEVGSTIYTVYKNLRALRAERLAHIGWRTRPQGKGKSTPTWVAGPGADARYPPRLSKAEISKRYRARHATEISLRRYGERSPYTQLHTPLWGGLLRKQP